MTQRPQHLPAAGQEMPWAQRVSAHLALQQESGLLPVKCTKQRFREAMGRVGSGCVFPQTPTQTHPICSGTIAGGHWDMHHVPCTQQDTRASSWWPLPRPSEEFPHSPDLGHVCPGRIQGSTSQTPRILMSLSKSHLHVASGCDQHSVLERMEKK